MVVLVLTASSYALAEFDEQVGYFCSSCVSSAAAAQRAQLHAAPLHCNTDGGIPDPDQPLICWGNTRRVVLGNHHTGQVFAFLVSWDDWPELSVEPSTMSSDEVDLYQSIIELRLDWEELLQSLRVEDLTDWPSSNVYHSYLASRSPLSQSEPLSQGENECPENPTVLDGLIKMETNPSGQGWMEQHLRDHVRDNISAFQDKQPWVSRITGIALQGLSFGGQLSWEPGEDGPNRLILSNEQPNELGITGDDGLVWEIELAGTTPSGAPLLGIQFRPTLSWVVNKRVSELLSGNVPIDDPCVAQKFAELMGVQVEYYELHPGEGLVNSFPMPPSEPNNEPLCVVNLCARTGVDGEMGPCQFTVQVIRPCMR